DAGLLFGTPRGFLGLEPVVRALQRGLVDGRRGLRWWRSHFRNRRGWGRGRRFGLGDRRRHRSRGGLRNLGRRRRGLIGRRGRRLGFSDRRRCSGVGKLKIGVSAADQAKQHERRDGKNRQRVTALVRGAQIAGR